MAGIDQGLVCQNDFPTSQAQADEGTSDVCMACMSIPPSNFETDSEDQGFIASGKTSFDVQIRKETTLSSVPNGCVKRKWGENGLVTHHLATALASVDEQHGRESDTERGACSSSVCLCEHQQLSAASGEISEPLSESYYTDTHDSCSYTRTDQTEEHKLCTSVSTLAITDVDLRNGIEYVVYESERQMPDIMRLITKDLSEPYSIYTYRYFIHNWPKLCFLAMDAGSCVGAIVCKLDMHKKMVRRGYIAMLAVDSQHRRCKIGSRLVLKAIRAMIADDCDEVVLETEITNKAALQLYENLGFVRDKRLFRYYLNGVDALRLKLWLR